MTEVKLNASAREALFNLKRYDRLYDRTQARLVTGKKINDITDAPVDFFRADSLQRQSTLLLSRKKDIDQAISALETQQTGIDSVTEYLSNLRGLITQAKNASNDEERIVLNDDFRKFAQQLADVIQKSEYNGINLINSDSSLLRVQVAEGANSIVQIEGVDFLGTADESLFSARIFSQSDNVVFSLIALTVGTATEPFLGFSAFGQNPQLAQSLDAYLTRAEGRAERAAASSGNRLGNLQSRVNFIEDYSLNLQKGAEKLTLANETDETAFLVALETRQQISITTLQTDKQRQQALLSLLAL